MLTIALSGAPVRAMPRELPVPDPALVLTELLRDVPLETIVGRPATGPEDLGTIPYNGGSLSAAQLLADNGLLYVLELYTLPSVERAMDQFFSLAQQRIPTGNEVEAGEFALYAGGAIVMHKSGQVLFVRVAVTPGAVLDQLNEESDPAAANVIRAIADASVIGVAQNVEPLLRGGTTDVLSLGVAQGGIDPCLGLPTVMNDIVGLDGGGASWQPSDRPPAMRCQVNYPTGLGFDVFTLTDEQLRNSVFPSDMQTTFENAVQGALLSGGTELSGVGDRAYLIQTDFVQVGALLTGPDGTQAMYTFVATADRFGGRSGGVIANAFQEAVARVSEVVPELAPATTTTTPATSSTSTTTSTTTTTSTSTTVAVASTTTAPRPAATPAPTLTADVDDVALPAGSTPGAVAIPAVDDGGGGSFGTVVAVGVPTVAAVGVGGVLLLRRRRRSQRRRRRRRGPDPEAPPFEVRTVTGEGSLVATSRSDGSSIGVRGVLGDGTIDARQREDPR